MLDQVLSFKRMPEKVKNKIVQNNLHLIAHNWSGFDSYVVLKNLAQLPRVGKLKTELVLFHLKYLRDM